MMDGETVMLDVESGHYFGLSGIGPHIWTMLEQDRSVGEIIADVKAEFAIGAGDMVDQDVTHFVQELVDKGLVTIVG
ncbi:PqqD family protein [Sphingomonas suaedae]|nr:PqqD family protein [Sphingomonas suaedae]